VNAGIDDHHSSSSREARARVPAPPAACIIAC
jgi:hypothetical protein